MELERPPFQLFRQGRALVAATALDAELLGRFSPTAPILARLVQERHAGQHRLYFALLAKVAESLPGTVTADDLHVWVKRNVVAEIIDHKTGAVTRLAPDSTAFEKMDQPAWSDFFRRVLDAMTTRIIPGLEKPALTREAAALIGYAA